jgi:hypothetical protein
LSYNLLTTLEEHSVPKHNSLINLDLSHNRRRTFRGDRFSNALNVSRPGDIYFNMDNNPSRCALVQLPTGYWTIRCDCDTGLQDVPDCPSNISCEEGNPNTRVIAPTQMCDGVLDCEDGIDEATCNQVGDLTFSPLCSSTIVDGCSRPCFRNTSLKLEHGRMEIIPTLVVCPDKGPQCQPFVLSIDGSNSASGLMGIMHITAGWGDGKCLTCLAQVIQVI